MQVSNGEEPKNGLQWDFWGVCWIFVTHLHNVIIKEQPEAVALHDGDVVPTVGATAGKEKKKELQIY